MVPNNVTRRYEQMKGLLGTHVFGLPSEWPGGENTV